MLDTDCLFLIFEIVHNEKKFTSNKTLYVDFYSMTSTVKRQKKTKKSKRLLMVGRVTKKETDR